MNRTAWVDLLDDLLGREAFVAVLTLPPAEDAFAMGEALTVQHARGQVPAEGTRHLGSGRGIVGPSPAIALEEGAALFARAAILSQ